MFRGVTRKEVGFTLIELLIVVVIIGILAAIAIPNVLAAQKKAKYARAASDTKTATTQSIVYANDKNHHPGTVTVLREAGYANVDDYDPWHGAWSYSPIFANTATPAAVGEVGVCSNGPRGAGVASPCTWPLAAKVPEVTDGTVGYSSVYGPWQGTS